MCWRWNGTNVSIIPSDPDWDSAMGFWHFFFPNISYVPHIIYIWLTFGHFHSCCVHSLTTHCAYDTVGRRRISFWCKNKKRKKLGLLKPISSLNQDKFVWDNAHSAEMEWLMHYAIHIKIAKSIKLQFGWTKK